MNFEYFPFDRQACTFVLRPTDLMSSDVIMKTPLLYTTDSYTRRLVKEPVLQLDSNGLQYDVTLTVMESKTVPYDDTSGFGFSFAHIHFSFVRKGDKINKLLISFYFPSGAFAILSLFSFFIKPNLVPGRMSMLVTIFLVVTTIYGTVEAPASRGFSYIEKWYIGVQIPILFALLEYGVILAIIKYNKKPTKKSTDKDLSMDDAFKIADLIAFCCSFTFIVIFNSTYLYVCSLA